MIGLLVTRITVILVISVSGFCVDFWHKLSLDRKIRNVASLTETVGSIGPSLTMVTLSFLEQSARDLNPAANFGNSPFLKLIRLDSTKVSRNIDIAYDVIENVTTSLSNPESYFSTDFYTELQSLFFENACLSKKPLTLNFTSNEEFDC